MEKAEDWSLAGASDSDRCKRDGWVGERMFLQLQSEDEPPSVLALLILEMKFPKE